MEAVYDRGGRVAGWLDGDELLDARGNYVAFVADGSVHSYKNGSHVAWWDAGVMRGPDGGVVSFTQGSSGFGPMRPMLAMKPMQPMKAMRPMKPMRAMRPMRPMRSLDWSRTTFGNW